MITAVESAWRPMSARVAVTEMLALLVDVPFPAAPVIWNYEAEQHGVTGLESAIRSWADAMDHVVYIESNRGSFMVVRRTDSRTLLSFRTDMPRLA